MSIFKQNSARHRAETPSHAVRNTTIAAAAGAAVVGSVAPAQAYAQAPAVSYSAPAYSAPAYSAPAYSAPAYSAPAYSAPATSSVANYTSYTYQAPVAQTAAAQGPTVTPQSTGVAPVAGGLSATAMQGVGSAYVYGGTAFGAWDCSGFTQWVYAQHGIDLPRTSQAQWAAGTPTANPQPGDLVIQNGGGHVGVYLGNGQMISALNPTQGTQVHSVSVMPVTAYVTF